MDQTFAQLERRTDVAWIDVRSEGEYAESHVPGAVSVPLFDNEERAEIGTLYKQVGPESARERGLEIASRKLPNLVRAIRERAGDRIPVIYCWRGGMRSQSVTTVLGLMGIPAVRLAGGYRAYRVHITEWLASMRADKLPPLLVIHGMTGVGKSMLLQLLKERGEPVLDLEGFAGHRGSVFGGIGLKPANQREFDGRLYDALQRQQNAPYLIIEAESKRIGHVNMPDFLYEAKLRGHNLLLFASLKTRVVRTLLQYRLDDEQAFVSAVEHALARIERRFSPAFRTFVSEAFLARDWHSLIAALLTDYYDPRYEHAMKSYTHPFYEVDGEDLEKAADEVVARAYSAFAVTDSGQREWIGGRTN
ncbi:tRNA 2-selenouridine(34) synthase MnmH [Ferroacidibacillus organovorans]|nr:tRNA 2-selenouridine(34) synthase MnmH [Ferroacidibacillus organovorans]